MCCTYYNFDYISFFCNVFWSKNKNDKSKSASGSNTVSVSEYAQGIENKLKTMIGKLDSVQDVSVFVMVDSTPKIEYLTETKTETKTSENGTNSTISETVVFEKMVQYQLRSL